MRVQCKGKVYSGTVVEGGVASGDDKQPELGDISVALHPFFCMGATCDFWDSQEQLSFLWSLHVETSNVQLLY